MRHGLREIVLTALFAGAAYAQVPREQEMMLGQRMAAEIDSTQRMITDGDVIGVVERVLRTLSRNESLRLPLKLRVFDNPELVASALPGGILVLSSGAILSADSEAELAGLLSHAMGHVQAGQYAMPIKSTVGIPLVFIGGKWGSCVRSAAGAGRVLMPAALLAQSNLLESQADMLGLGYMTNAGYDTQALVSVFDRWRGKSGPDEEVKSKVLALTNVAASTILNTSAFDQIKARLAPPPSPRQVPTLYK